MSNATGGPAFPCIEATMTGISSDGEERYENEAHGGMTLRDYFAAKAMQGWLSNSTATPVEESLHEKATPRDMADVAALFAYLCADAMLEARQV